MGRTITEWRAKVLDLVRDPTSKDLSTTQTETVGIRPAIAQFSVDRPRQLYVEQAGTGSAYLALPAGWVTGISRLVAIEHPARADPPNYLDPQSWRLVRSVADVSVEQILVDRTPIASEYVRFSFTGAWPYPTGVAGDDKIDDVAYEAVAALAASFCEISLASEAARSRAGAMPTDFADGRERHRSLVAAADQHRTIYDRFLGLGGGDGAGDGVGASGGPASGYFDMDPAYRSLFHGGRR